MLHCYTRPLIPCLLLVCGVTAASYGQVSQLPASILTDPDPTPQKATIDQFDDYWMKKLMGSDPTGWSQARSEMTQVVGKPDDTAGFLDVYATELSKSMKKLARSPEVHSRLNSAIIVAKVAAKVANKDLAETTEIFLHDNSDAVVLWGMESAKFVVPALLHSTNETLASKVAQEVVQAAKDHLSAATTEEAYRTVLLDAKLGTPERGDKELIGLSSRTISDFLPQPTAMYAWRIKLYDQSQPPPQALADKWGTSFFIKQAVWAAQTPKQQMQTLGLMLALLKGAARQNAANKSPEMFDVLKDTGQAMGIAADKMKNDALIAAAKGLANISNDIPADDLDAKIKALDDAIKAMGGASAGSVAIP